jgi:lipopolysaccharide export system protein LptA
VNRVFLIAALVFCGVIEAPGQQAGQQQAAQPKASPGKSAPADAKTGKTGGTDLFGGDSGERSKGPVEITAKQTADFDSRNRTAVFVGSVKVVDPQFTLTADKVTALMNRSQDGGGLNQADAEGNVFIVHLNEPKPAASPSPTPAGRQAQATPSPSPSPQQPVRSTAKAEKAVYIAKDGSVTLTGWPEVTQGNNTHVATEPGVKMVLYRDGRMKTYGSTRTLIQDRTQPNQPQTTNGAQQTRN